jgi:phytanoyl-CoA hydroxylase
MITIDRGKATHDYERDGFIRVKEMLSPSELTEVRDQLRRFERDIAPNLEPAYRGYEADGKAIRNLFYLEKFDPFFASFGQREDIRQLVSSLVHGDPILIAVETFNKPSKVGSGVPPHQDNAYFCQSPPDVLTVWIALDAATIENGPIYYLKGSHAAGVLPHRPSGVAGNSMGLTKMPEHERGDEFCGTLEPGDALIHHCQTIHWSAPNKTDYPRCGLLLVYRGAHTGSDAELRARYDAARK